MPTHIILRRIGGGLAFTSGLLACGLFWFGAASTPAAIAHLAARGRGLSAGEVLVLICQLLFLCGWALIAAGRVRGEPERWAPYPIHD